MIPSDLTRALQDAEKEVAELLAVTVKEYAGLFRRHPQTVYTAIRQGRLPHKVERPTGGGFMILVPKATVEKLRAA